MSESIGFIWNWIEFTAAIERHPDGKLRKIALSSDKPGSTIDAFAHAEALLCSAMLINGVSADVIRNVLPRDAQGLPRDPLGAALDQISKQAEETVND